MEPSAAEFEELYRLDLDERELHAPVGRGRGPHKPLSLRSKQPPVKEMPHCHGLPVFLASRGALPRPAGCDWCFAMGRGRGRGYYKYHLTINLILIALQLNY